MGARNSSTTKLARPYVCSSEELSLYGEMSLAPVIETLEFKIEKKNLMLFEVNENIVRKATDFALHALRVNKCLDLKVRGFNDEYIMGFIGWKSTDMVANYCNHFSAYDVHNAKRFQDLIAVNEEIFINQNSDYICVSSDGE